MKKSRKKMKVIKIASPLIADACVSLNIPLRIAPQGIHPLLPNSFIYGRVLPVKHFGSVDIFLEAIENAKPGDILVIDNDGRRDEGCIGDLTVYEAKAAKLLGIILWGCHRDTSELLKIKFPVFSFGTYPSGPTRLDKRNTDALAKINFGNITVDAKDFVFADDDGVIFVESFLVERVIETAKKINTRERRQAKELKQGISLRKQLKFGEYLKMRNEDPSYSFRKHLKSVKGAIEV